MNLEVAINPNPGAPSPNRMRSGGRLWNSFGLWHHGGGRSYMKFLFGACSIVAVHYDFML